MDDDLYEDLRADFRLPPLQFVYGAMILRLLAMSYLFLNLPLWQRITAFVLHLTFAELTAAYGWPFWKRATDSP